MTGVVAVGIMALTDFLISYFITMELEERELIQRFGDQYREYQMRVSKFFPKIRSYNKRRRKENRFRNNLKQLKDLIQTKFE